MNKQTLSDKKKTSFDCIPDKNNFYFYEEEDVKEFIKEIKEKVLLDWKGQNEFIDWINKKAGDDLNDRQN